MEYENILMSINTIIILVLLYVYITYVISYTRPKYLLFVSVDNNLNNVAEACVAIRGANADDINDNNNLTQTAARNQPALNVHANTETDGYT